MRSTENIDQNLLKTRKKVIDITVVIIDQDQKRENIVIKNIKIKKEKKIEKEILINPKKINIKQIQIKVQNQ